MKKQLFLLFSLNLLFAIGCNFGNSNKDGIKKESKLDWNCLSIDNEEICIPADWKLIKQSKYLFYSKVKESDSQTFFVILKYNKISNGLSIKRYLQETYSTLRKDSLERFIGYTSKKLLYKDRSSYYGEYYTQINRMPYITYSMVFEGNNDIYEFALKCDSNDASRNKDVFGKILFRYKHDGKPVFSGKDEIRKSEIIDLSKL